MPFDLYVWQSPRDVDDEGASALVREWEAAGADPALGPFEPRRDIGWFHRELVNDRTSLELVSDAIRTRAPNRPGCRRRTTSRRRGWSRSASRRRRP